MTEAKDMFSSLIANCIFNVFLSYTAIMLNIITILALRKTLSLPKPLKTLLLSLAVSDLGVGLVVQPLHITSLVMKMEENNENNQTYNNVANALNKMENLFFCASFFGVTALTADRFLAIHFYLRYQEFVTHKRVVAVVISIWMVSAFLLFTSFWIPVNVKVIFVATMKVVCYITTGYFYYKIYLAVQHHTHRVHALQVAESNETVSHFARLIKSAIGTFYVYLVFLACYLPSTCLAVASISNGQSSLASHLSLFAPTLMHLNSSLNPLIYCWKMRDIRHAIINILRNIFPRKAATEGDSEVKQLSILYRDQDH